MRIVCHQRLRETVCLLLGNCISYTRVLQLAIEYDKTTSSALFDFWKLSVLREKFYKDIIMKLNYFFTIKNHFLSPAKFS